MGQLIAIQIQTFQPIIRDVFYFFDQILSQMVT